MHWQFLVQELPTLCWRQNVELTYNMASHQRDTTSLERSEPQSVCHFYSWPHIFTCLASPGEPSPSLRLHSPLISPAWSPLLGIRFAPQSPAPPLATRPLHLEFSFPLLSVLSPHQLGTISGPDSFFGACSTHLCFLSPNSTSTSATKTSHSSWCQCPGLKLWSGGCLMPLPSHCAHLLHAAEGPGPWVLALLC